MEEKKGGAAARQLCINSNTCVLQDMHVHHNFMVCAKDANTITEVENIAYF